jgi:hypothetical protein
MVRAFDPVRAAPPEPREKAPARECRGLLLLRAATR